MTPEEKLSFSRSLVWLACLTGSVHAGFSLYWALGGRWLLTTVGQWAVQLSVEAPVEAGLVLGIVAMGKVVAATVPVAVAYARMPWQRFWRAVSWAGGLLLVAYGGVNTVISGAVLGGAIRPESGYDPEAMVGHAWLWDPLFFLWGAALVLSLWYSRRNSQVFAQADPRPTFLSLQANSAGEDVELADVCQPAEGSESGGNRFQCVDNGDA